MKADVNKLKNLLSKFNDEAARLRNTIYELEDLPKMEALVGKYFKYNNSYSSTENWWMYFYIKKMQNSYLIIDSFEENSRSEVYVKFNRKEYGSHFSNPNYIEITKKEYDVEVKKLLDKLAKKFK